MGTSSGSRRARAAAPGRALEDDEAKRWDEAVARFGVDEVRVLAAEHGDVAVSEWLAGRAGYEAVAGSRVRNRLRAIELERQQLLAERRELVDTLKQSGWTWDRVEALFGVSRVALIK